MLIESAAQTAGGRWLQHLGPVAEKAQSQKRVDVIFKSYLCMIIGYHMDSKYLNHRI